MKTEIRTRNFFLALLLCLWACSEDHSGQRPDPVILSPLDESRYYTGEAVGLRAEVPYFPGFSHMEIYLDDVFLFESDRQTVDTLIPDQMFSEGSHRFNVIVLGDPDHLSKCEVSFHVEHHLGESKNMESFGEDHIDAWSLSGWSPASSAGYDDDHSLRSSSSYAVALTRKHFEEDGSVRFYVKDGSGKLEFWMDGEVKAKWFGKEGWGEYAYAVPSGMHVFRWISTSEDTFLDQVAFTPGQEQHTPGEVYGGGTIFYLDSSGLHGLIATFEDGSYKGNYEIPWGCYGLNILSGNRAQSTTDGAGNTWAIVSDCQLENIAARYCFNLTTYHSDSIQDDWYLPALLELKKLYTNREMLEGLGGQYYWSSTSYSTNAASVFDFRDGSHHGAHRNIPNISGPSTASIHVRPIRKF